MALELPAALSDVDRRLRTAPGDGAARLERATILATWGRRREASREYARALAGGQERAPVLCAIARTDLDAGDSDRALIVVEHALRLDPTDDRAKLLMARVRAARSEHDAARSILRELQSRLGTNAEYSFTYADCLRGCGDFETAIEVVDRAIEMERFDKRIRRVKIEKQYDPDAGSVFLLPQAMQQVLINLIQNAADSIEDDTGTVTLRARLHSTGRGTATDRRVILEVEDTGAGITPEVQERLFDPFFSTKDNNGTGLGLPIAAKIIEQHKGTLDFETRLGHGTVFRITLPASGQ